MAFLDIQDENNLQSKLKEDINLLFEEVKVIYMHSSLTKKVTFTSGVQYLSIGYVLLQGLANLSVLIVCSS